MWPLLAFILLLGIACSKQTEADPHEHTEGAAQNDHHGDHDQDGDQHHELAVLTDAQYREAGIQLGKLDSCTAMLTITANGQVDVPPSAISVVHSPAAGLVQNLQILPGQHVTKGQLLCKISHPSIIQLQQDYLELLAKLPSIEAEADRQSSLAKEDATASKRMESSKAELQSLLARKAGLEQQLKLMGLNVATVKSGNVSATISINSPIDGDVRSVFVNPGAYVNPQDALLDVLNTSHKHLELKVFEQHAGALAQGQEVMFTSPILNGRWSKAHVFLAGKTFDATQRTLNIHAHLDNEADETLLLPGMFVEAKIMAGKLLLPCVPAGAIAHQGNKTFIFFKVKEAPEKGKVGFEKVEVQLSPLTSADASKVLLTKDPEDDCELVVKGAQTILASTLSGEAGHDH